MSDNIEPRLVNLFETTKFEKKLYLIAVSLSMLQLKKEKYTANH